MKTNIVNSFIIALFFLFSLAGCENSLLTDYDDVTIKDFCTCANLEDIGKTIPLVNQYLGGLKKELNEKQRLQALTAWFQSHPCVVDARIIEHETISGYPPKRDVAFSFKDGEIIRELILDFSTTSKVLSYHYDAVNGVAVKTKKGITIDEVFNFINSVELDVNYIYGGVYISTMPPENLQYILDCLNAKPYTNDGNSWWVSGNLNYQTNRITIFPRLYNMKNSEYQTDWLQSMNDYNLVEAFDYNHNGHIISFQIPEALENPWETAFKKYEFVEWAEFSYNRYTIFDASIGTGSGKASVDSKINIRMAEIFDKSPRTLQLHCSTEKIYPCVNYPLYTAHRQSSNSIDISFKGVIATDFCFTALGPATAIIDLEALKNGSYNLSLYNGNVKHTGQLVVSSDSYKLKFDKNSAFNFSSTELYRIPEHTIWGYIGYHKQETSALVRSFLTALMDLGAQKKSYQPGNYGSFEIDKKGDIAYPGASFGYWFDQPFIFHYSGNLTKIEQLVNQYARDHSDHISIAVFTDKGEKFYSWTMK